MSKNKSKTTSNRGSFNSSLGFIMATAGSAIGLGNLWKFPYIAGMNGGGVFILFYIIFVILLGRAILMAEMSIGRNTRQSIVGAYQKINKKWTFLGIMGVVCCFIILSYYSVVGGWVLKYIAAYFTGGNFGGNTSDYFSSFVASPLPPVFWHILFMFLTAAVIIFGVSKGIEKASKVLLPGLFVLVIVVAIRSASLEGGIEGIKFLFIPDWSVFASPQRLFSIIAAAMGQVFFSLSLGFGITLTYGSYMKKDTNIAESSLTVVSLDTIMALISGIAILPAVFAFGFEPSAGPGLIFETLPSIFSSMPMGNIFGLIFFILVFFAAITSSMALLEVVTAFLIDSFHWSRKKATIVMSSLIALLGVFASLSMGVLSGFTVAEMNLFDSLSYITDKILIPVSAILTCIFIGHVWGTENAVEEIEQDSVRLKGKRIFTLTIKYIAPIIISIVFVMGLLNI